MFAASCTLGAVWATSRIFSQVSISYFVAATLWGIASCLSKGPVGFFTIFVPFLMAIGLCSSLRKGSTEQSSTIRQNLSSISPKHWKDIVILAILIVFFLTLGNGWWLLARLWYPETVSVIYHDVESLNIKHGKFVFYYFYQAPLLIAPWSLLFVLACVAGAISLYTKGKAMIEKKEQSGKPWDSWGLTFAFLWFILGFIILSSFPAKKGRYFFMLLPSASILLAVFCDYLLAHPILTQSISWVKHPLTLQRLVLSFTSLAGIASIVLLVGMGMVSPWILLSLPLFLVAAMIMVKKESNVASLVVDTSFYMALATSLVFICLPMTSWGESGYESAYKVKSVTQNAPLYLLGNYSEESEHELLWAIGRNFIPISELTRLSHAQETFFILVCKPNKSNVETFFQKNLHLVYEFVIQENKNQTTWYVYRRQF
jgi:hypothetical protein